MNNQPVDSAFQMPRPVIQVGALSEQKLLTGIRYGKNKGIAHFHVITPGAAHAAATTARSVLVKMFDDVVLDFLLTR